jgi:hypothetical protein
MPISQWLREGRRRLMQGKADRKTILLLNGWEIATLFGLLLVMVASMASLAAGVYQPFIYFKF